ncbi:MAG: sigma-70 family RNA polymerase sigma factor [Bacilli bacterium]|nr:sigma-70 family RNA polymerase sigma factor [Bacilli bacterium]
MKELTELILENEKLIYKAVNRFPYYRDKEDLYQAGCKGMQDAYRTYDPNKGAKFTSHAYRYILGEMMNVVNKDRCVKVSREVTRLNNQIEKAKSMLAQKLMRQPTITELSDYLEVPEYYLIEAMNSNVTAQSIDSMVGDTNMMLHEVISSKEIDVDTLLYLKTELESLNEPERTIMIQRYYEDMTQTEVANSLGLSQVDVSRREKKVLTKIRSGLTSKTN